ncbi:hypothetical protein RB195_000553 [Necator americanus]|uniref:One cut domain family member n=1 Tax=Necator americanus TaxID=51031 RepID=A0ABR1DAA9_NECAM
MEGLESGGLAADPLLSAALSSPLGSSREELFLHDFARSSPHAGALFGNYATLTTLQPLPPISTVTSNGGKFSRSNSPVRERQNNYFFPPSSQSSYNYNVNIKYEYDLKNEEDSNDSPPGQPPCSTPSDYTQNHASQPVETNFSSASFVPSYSGIEIRSPKIEKDCFFNGYTNGDCEIEEEPTCLPKNCSPVENGHGSIEGEEEDDGEELNTKDLAQRISAELKRYSIPQAIFAQKILCRSQGTLSDLLRNPKPWSKLKSGRETFRRMAKWLQEPEFKRMSDLRMAGVIEGAHGGMVEQEEEEEEENRLNKLYCAGPAKQHNTANESFAVQMPPPPKTRRQRRQLAGDRARPITAMTNTWRVGEGMGGKLIAVKRYVVVTLRYALEQPCKRKEEQQVQHNQPQPPKKPRLVFTDIQRRTLQAIFKETKRPSREMQLTISQQLGLDPTTVANFFMNARRRGHDQRPDDDTSTVSSGSSHAFDDQVLSPLPPTPIFEQL